jgi:hypothetical protein
MAGDFRALVLITNLNMLLRRGEGKTITLSSLERPQVARGVLDWKDMDPHVCKIAAISRKGTCTLLEEPARLS